MGDSGSIQSNDCVVEFSPGGTTKFYIPQCHSSLKPFVNQKFHNLEDGIQFYTNYAFACGFDIRRFSTRKLDDGKCFIWRYIVCNKECVKHTVGDISSPSTRRQTVSNRCGCKARVVFKFAGLEGYIVTKFIEKHNHVLVPEAYRYFMKMNSKLDVGHKKFIMDCTKANVGAMQSYKMLKSVAGSYSAIGCSRVQVKIFSRDLKAYVLDADAHMVIDKLQRRRESCPAFVFEFEVDKQDQLKSLFWADPISRRNYCAFGDVVSFDATYSTNGYGMIFAPFTGKDNHGKCVTLGAALMSGESIESYAWVFRQFKKCMVHEPAILMTDQDPAIKVAVERVFEHTRHRLCMWHIMSKVPEKLPAHLKKNPSFLKEFCTLVWSVNVEPNVFESRWNDLMIQFGLTNEQWFATMYDIHKSWLPAYFRDFKMGGLFRTTSPSESENSFFRMHMSHHSNLLQFFMYFDNALESQRHAQAKLNIEDLSSCRDFRTLLKFERHATTVYTESIFKRMPEDIQHACYSCHLTSITNDEVKCVYQIDDRTHGVFSVIYDKMEKNIDCSCKKFVMVGLLCCHVLFVFKDLNYESIPEKYIVSRWTKQALSNPSNDVGGDVMGSCAFMEDNRFIMYDIIAEFYSCLSWVDGDSNKANSLLEAIRGVKDAIKPNEGNEGPENPKKRLFDDYYQATVPNEVTIRPPAQVKTKGSRSRIKSGKETSAEKKDKPLRTCKACGKRSHHDSWNCPHKECDTFNL